jgi:ABC-type Mn2+/Zn2+ transport system ATPase subunit/ABC-type Zn uptake system ZnuABC Zn-binding protein ZnuA
VTTIKIYLIFLCFIVLSFQSAAGKEKVIATTTFLKDIAQNIAGDKFNVVSIMPIGGDPHIDDPVPQDAKLIADADLIIKNGLFLEGWLDKLISNSGTKGSIITASQRVTPIVSEVYHGSPDPHAWMDVNNAKIYAQNICIAFEQLLPRHADYFRKNLAQYSRSLDELDHYVTESVKKIDKSQRILITSHDAFRYFGNRYGLRVESVLGTSTDADVQVQDVRNLIDVIREHKLKAIFVESTINPKLINQIAADMGIRIGGKLFADSLGDEESGSSTYIGMIRNNTDQIVDGLIGTTVYELKSDNQFEYLIISVVILFSLSFIWVSNKLINKGSDVLPEDAFIDINGVGVSYGNKTILSNLYLKIYPGKVYGVLGPNGAGKSTLFKSILDIVPLDSGQVYVGGRNISEVRSAITYIPQKEEIDWAFPATVADVVMMGRYPHKRVFERINRSDHRIVSESLEKLGIGDLKNKQIGELSGGQQQRVFLARALCQEAQIFLFDEPFVGVDIVTEEKIIGILKNLASLGKTILVIHHDLSKVEDYFDQVIMLNLNIVAAGVTSDVFTPENIRKTYSGRSAISEETDEFIHARN